MGFLKQVAVGIVALGAGASGADAAESKMWYVYCEGTAAGEHWAVFSENFWTHPLTDGYSRRVGSAAKTFFESSHDLPLEGCAAVNFVDTNLAEHSRTRTAQLHKNMGDRVYYFRLPHDVLPAEAPAPRLIEYTPPPASTPAKEPGKDAREWMPTMAPR